METTKNIVETSAELAQKPIVQEIAGRPHAFVPQGYALQDLGKLLPRPQRASGSVALHDTASFNSYVNRMKAGADPLIYCTADFATGAVRFTAVFNEHGDSTLAGWRDARAVYQIRASEEWKRWNGHNAKPLGQVEFATFLEDNLRDITVVEGFPTGPQMLEMALQMEVNQDARFKSSIRLQSGGTELAYVDQEDDATLKKMRVFERFAIGVPPFFNGQPYQVTARLRYRAKEGRVSFWYELVRPDLVVQDAARAEISAIGAATGVAVVMGEPDAK